MSRTLFGAVAMSALASTRHAQAALTALAPATPFSPEQALQALYDGNRRFASGHSEQPHRELSRLKEVAAKQTPFAAVLACADSRVPVEIAFDQGFGDLFVTRVAGNVVNPETIGSLEFGTSVLGAKVIMVLGHSSCGAVTAALKNEPVPGQISSLFYHMEPALRLAQGDLVRAVTENIRLQAHALRSSPVISGLMRDGKLTLAGGYYELATGVVTKVEL